jgi:hypothetical protein
MTGDPFRLLQPQTRDTYKLGVALDTDQDIGILLWKVVI